VDWFFDLLGQVSTGCLFVVLLTFVGTLGMVGIFFWRALTKKQLVLGVIHEGVVKRNDFLEGGYMRALEAGRGLQNIADTALSGLEGTK
jgi:hypothetical protein